MCITNYILFFIYFYFNTAEFLEGGSDWDWKQIWKSDIRFFFSQDKEFQLLRSSRSPLFLEVKNVQNYQSTFLGNILVTDL